MPEGISWDRQREANERVRMMLTAAFTNEEWANASMMEYVSLDHDDLVVLCSELLIWAHNLLEGLALLRLKDTEENPSRKRLGEVALEMVQGIGLLDAAQFESPPRPGEDG